ncbi:MAG: SH3 domain-containing protein [Methyloceanibacter sp.]
MQNKVLLSLWLVGSVLYLAGTIFFANAILGAGSRSTDLAADKGLATRTGAAPEAQCAPGSAANGAEAEASKLPQDQAKVASQVPDSKARQPVKTAALPAPGGEDADQASDGDSAQPPRADSGPQPSDDVAAPDSGEQGHASTPEANQGQGQAEWAQVVTAAVDVHSQPSQEAPSIYALPAGRQVRVLTRDHGWTQVQDAASGGTGWVDARALAPIGAPGQRRDYGNSDEDANADDWDGQDDWRWQRRHHHAGAFGDFVRRALGGGW